MAISFAQIASDFPDFLKIIQDGVAIEADIQKSGFLVAVPDLLQYRGDIEKLFNDIAAFGATQGAAKPAGAAQ